MPRARILVKSAKGGKYTYINTAAFNGIGGEGRNGGGND